MSWRDWARIVPRKATTLAMKGAEVRVTETRIVDAAKGIFPELHLYPSGEDREPEVGIVVDAGASRDDLEHLADQAERWAEQLREAARTVGWREDSEALDSEDDEDDEVRPVRSGVGA
ncbi:hypothetical protein [Nocardiopsis synnemataformans]|uniref:hypothetical protein n=1 Tax=Nocardiopsis synnemataformans TaxID=61305 RepID=UPI003EBCC640